MKIALLGAGLMGRAIARRLKAQGYQVTVWNRSPGALRELASSGVSVCDSAAQACESAQLILLTLSDAAAIDSVLFEPTPVPLSERILLQMGTIAPDESRQLEIQARALGCAYLEAPVLGSIPEAESGTLIIMAGGEEALFERLHPLLGSLGEKPIRVGKVGQGAALKLAMNQLIATLTAGFSLSLGLVREEGIAVDLFMELLRGSAVYAPTFDKKLPRMLAGEFSHPNFPLKHLLKDVALFRQVAAATGLDQSLLAALQARLEQGCEQGLADQDYSALYTLLNPHAD